MSYGDEVDFQCGASDSEWDKGCKLAKKGAEDALVDWCFSTGIDPRAAKLFCAVVAEDERLGKVIAAGEHASAKVGQMERELGFTYRALAIEPKAKTRIEEIERELRDEGAKAEHARIANVHRNGIRQRWPKLLGQ